MGMLVLGRRQNEDIILTDGKQLTITIKVTEAIGKVDIGIDAPRDITIIRGEHLEARRRSQSATIEEDPTAHADG